MPFLSLFLSGFQISTYSGHWYPVHIVLFNIAIFTPLPQNFFLTFSGSGKFDERKFTKLRKTSFSDVLWLCLHWRICVPPIYTYGYCVYSRAFIRPDSSEVVHALVFRNGTGAEEGRRLKENRNDCHFDESKNFSRLLFANVFSHLSNYTPNGF
jgi:hypothetical protein